MIFIPIILFFGVLLWDLLTDYSKWKKERSVNHTKEAWLRISLLIPSIVLFTVLHPYNTWKVLICVLLMEFFTFWLLFDGIYNLLRKQKWSFPGTNEKDDAGLDNIAEKLGPVFTQVIKIAGVIGFIFIYIYSFIKHSA